MNISRSKFFVAACLLFALTAVPLGAADLSNSYVWKPVRIGGGGFVVGMVTHPLNPAIRYARTDVGEAYRWDNTRREWLPMKVRAQVRSEGLGMPMTAASAPSPGGVQSLAVDPSAPSTVYLACPTPHSADIGGDQGITVYKSTDGGRTFRAGNLNVPGSPNDDWRTSGERLAVDPRQGRIIYFGTPWQNPNAPQKSGSGLYRSVDGGATWNPVVGGNAPPLDANVINVLFDGRTTTSAFGLTKVSLAVYAVVGDGDVYRSTDGGQSWANLSAGTGLSGHANMTVLAPDGSLWVAQSSSQRLWKYAGGKWITLTADTGGDTVHCVAVDPTDPRRVWAVGNDGGTGLSTDGGEHWTAFGRLKFANTLGWLPQTVGSAIWGNTRSVGTLQFDSQGTLWIAMGQEGTLCCKPTGQESASDPPRWTIASKGIEELVAQDVILPKGSGDTAIVAAADTTGFVISSPDDFSAIQIPLQKDFGLISQGTGVAACPNDSTYLAMTSSNVYMGGRSLSGFSQDGGKTWQPFGAALQYTDNGKSEDVQAGSIAVSVRPHPRPDASDIHLVQLPVDNLAPIYSHDGGRTWQITHSFPLAANGISLGSGYQGFWIFALKQHLLSADPFVADKFYLKLTHAPAGFYVSTDGGVTWAPQPSANLPDNTHHGQMAVNNLVQNDLWFVDGWEGASEHGLWHSTDGGATFQKSHAFSHALTLALGKGSPHVGGKAYSVYVYGQAVGDSRWGVFRSTDGGASWDRVSYYPTGIYDQPTCMAASWDTFGKVWVGFGGSSFVYGVPLNSLPSATRRTRLKRGTAPKHRLRRQEKSAEWESGWT